MFSSIAPWLCSIPNSPAFDVYACNAAVLVFRPNVHILIDRLASFVVRISVDRSILSACALMPVFGSSVVEVCQTEDIGRA